MSGHDSVNRNVTWFDLLKDVESRTFYLCIFWATLYTQLMTSHHSRRLCDNPVNRFYLFFVERSISIVAVSLIFVHVNHCLCTWFALTNERGTPTDWLYMLDYALVFEINDFSKFKFQAPESPRRQLFMALLYHNVLLSSVCKAVWRLPYSARNLSNANISRGLRRGADWAAWHSPGRPVGPPARWAATSYVEGGSGIEEEVQGYLPSEGGLYSGKLFAWIPEFLVTPL